ncbi:MAG TPA: citrate/2-methylcitrate synthase [Elusimicrobiota bacterium]|jgi:2-methylcitrate synthase|nr:citrate/2-methylcitrate synthase [Elusimicrobiota bacterium]
MPDAKSNADALLKSVMDKKTAEAYSPGLEGVIAAKSKLCSIDGAAGKLYYMGYPIEEIVNGSATYEEIAYMFWHGRLPNTKELETFKDEIAKSRSLPQQVMDFIKLLPHTCHPMDALRTIVSLLSAFDHNPERSPEANLDRAIALTVRFPTIVAAFHRLRQNQAPVEPDPKLSHAANFLYMLFGEKPDETTAKVMDIAMVLHLDHEMNASTFSSLVTASTLSDLYSAISAGVGTLKGPLHGGANEAVLKMLLEIGDPDRVGAYVDDALAKKKKIMGFGHRMYKAYDPRARLLKEYARRASEKTKSSRLFQITEKIEEVMIQKKGKQGIFPNVDLYSGIIYHQMGIPTDIFTPIFAIARVAGWTAHVLEYWQENRLFRPNALYEGPSARKFPPLAQR